MKRKFVVLACFDVDKQKGLIVSDSDFKELYRLYGNSHLGFSDNAVWVEKRQRNLGPLDEIEVDLVDDQEVDELVPERLDLVENSALRFIRTRQAKSIEFELAKLHHKFRAIWITNSPSKSVHASHMRHQGFTTSLAVIRVFAVTCKVRKNSRGKLRPYLSFDHQGNSFTLPYMTSTDPEFSDISTGHIRLVIGLGEPFWGDERYKLVYGVIHVPNAMNKIDNLANSSTRESEDIEDLIGFLDSEYAAIQSILDSIASGDPDNNRPS